MSAEHSDDGHRRFMIRVLGTAAEHFGLSLVGDPVFGWRERTIGSRVTSADGPRWLRVTSEHQEWAHDQFWEGNKDASAITAVPKPTVLAWHDWREGVACQRAEVMTLIQDRPVAATPEPHTPPVLSTGWWATLRRSLDTLAVQPTERVTVEQERVSERLRLFFGDWIDPTVTAWSTAHGDLHWGNLTAPACHLLDWEQWGRAPVGYDAASLYCHSLLVPSTAATVHAMFADLLDNEAGRLAQLCVISRQLVRIEGGDYPELAIPLHRLADRLLGRSRGT